MRTPRLKAVLNLAATVSSLFFSLSTSVAAPIMTVDDLLAVKWIGAPTLSPDGKSVVFAVTQADKKANKKFTELYYYRLKNGSLKKLTNSGGSNHSPVFTPDGKQVVFLSDRSQSSQIWEISLNGGEASQLTKLKSGASGPLTISPDGALVAFVSNVFPSCRDDACHEKTMDQKKKSKVKARVFEHLMYRHWNQWLDERRQHIFIARLDGKEQPRDLTPGQHYAPPIALGGARDFVFSPDSKRLAFVSNHDNVLANSTNNDLFEVRIRNGKVTRVSASQGNDNSPRYSPDGSKLAYLSMAKAAYESDLPRLMVYEPRTRRTTRWAPKYKGHPVDLEWSRDNKTLFFTAPHHGFLEIFSASKKTTKQLSKKAYVKGLQISPNKKTLVFTNQSAKQPPELSSMSVDGGEIKKLTGLNNWLALKLNWQSAEHHWFVGAKKEKVHAVLLKPPGFRKGRRYPALVMIHGGPQGMTGDSFHPRWNLQMFARKGYVVFGINFHGSVGFGQKFTDSIRGDWGGKPFVDIQKGTEYLARLPFVKGKQLCAAGASYGGYMVNWLATQTKRFRCLISHAGVYNIESKYGSTEELWFPEWDWRGTPWTNRKLYRRFSPHSYAEKIKTPTLVIHGQHDYRVPVEQGFQMFTALQRQGVPSKFLYFPDEDHFVQKPQNIELWWNTMQSWLESYL